MTIKQNPTDFFNEEMAQAYDERNSKLAPIKDALLFTTNLILRELPEDAKILCVGAGTGSEIITLSESFPKWRFIALEPSKSMLDVCKDRIEHANITKKCEFVHGYIENLSLQTSFDAVISLFVGHFVEKNKRVLFFENMIQRLNPNGYLVHAEISFDLSSKKYPPMLEKWKEVQRLMGATSESLEKLPTQLKEMLTVLPPAETEKQIEQGGLKQPIRFFQALMVCGWFGKKD